MKKKQKKHAKYSKGKSPKHPSEIYGSEASLHFIWGVRICLSFTVPHRPVLILLAFYDPPSASDSFHSKRILQPPCLCTLPSHIQSSLVQSHVSKDTWLWILQGRGRRVLHVSESKYSYSPTVPVFMCTSRAEAAGCDHVHVHSLWIQVTKRRMKALIE